MLGIATTGEARRAAIALISPLIAGSRARLGPIPDSTWRQPYMLGFVGMLISLAAARETEGRLSESRLGIAQVGAWMALTGIADEMVGEDFCYLSASQQKDFMLGCRNATLFYSARDGTADPADPEIARAMSDTLLDDDPSSDFALSETLPDSPLNACAIILWRRYFEAPICGN